MGYEVNAICPRCEIAGQFSIHESWRTATCLSCHEEFTDPQEVADIINGGNDD